jgi:hypothetical protein
MSDLSGELRTEERARGVERAELAIEVRGTDEIESAGGDDGPTVVLGAGVGQPLGRQFGVTRRENPPREIARVQVDGVQRAPWRRDSRIAAGPLLDVADISAFVLRCPMGKHCVLKG